MIPSFSATVVSYKDIGIGLWLALFGVLFLSDLRHPKEKRTSRWGRGGRGAPCSTLSIFTWGGVFSGVGLSLILKGFGRVMFDQSAFREEG